METARRSGLGKGKAGRGMKIGVIGVGHLASAVLKGLLRSGMAPQSVCLSPRGRGPELAAAHGFVLAADNAALVSRCDMVLLAVRPADAVGAVRDLPWRAEQILVSACAGVTIERLAEGAGPARIVRIMPITASELGASPTPVFPLLPEVRPVLEALGPPIALGSEDQFEAATVSAAIYGWAQALIRTGAQWGARNGLDPVVARQLMARTFVASGRMQGEQDAPMDALLASLCTPGGITEAGLRSLEGNGVPEAWDEACDLVLQRLRGPG